MTYRPVTPNVVLSRHHRETEELIDAVAEQIAAWEQEEVEQ